MPSGKRSESGEKRRDLEKKKTFYYWRRLIQTSRNAGSNLERQLPNMTLDSIDGWTGWNCCRRNACCDLRLQCKCRSWKQNKTNKTRRLRHLLDCSLEALCERGGSGQSAVIRRPADKERLLQVKIDVQVLMREDKKRRHRKARLALNNDHICFLTSWICRIFLALLFGSWVQRFPATKQAEVDQQHKVQKLKVKRMWSFIFLLLVCLSKWVGTRLAVRQTERTEENQRQVESQGGLVFFFPHISEDCLTAPAAHGVGVRRRADCDSFVRMTAVKFNPPPPPPPHFR